MEWIVTSILTLAFVVFIVHSLEKWQERKYRNIGCERCGITGSTQPFRGTEECPEFYKVPLNLCAECREAQHNFITHRFMIGVEGRLGFGRADLVADARKLWGDRAVDVLALLAVAREDEDQARRVLERGSYEKVRPWIKENLPPRD